MIILSNGHSKFIVGPAAVEAYRNGLLAGFITGGYPTVGIRRWISLLKLGRYGPVTRLLQRQEKLPDEFVHPMWWSEIVGQFNRFIKKITRNSAWFDWIEDYALRLYARQAESVVNNLSAKIYHYRAGYGHQSVQIAKQKGMIALCDHSIAHPAALDYLISNGGKLPPRGQTGYINKMWSNVLKDIEQADYVLVNSDFVKETFINYGCDPGRIRVLYTGIDDRFLSLISSRTYRSSSDSPVRLLFAGDLGMRKGGEVLLQALSRIRDLPWQFETIGTIDPKLRLDFQDLFADSRMKVTGYLSWPELAQRMSAADIFVFPSLAEGSARVIFMAMACGCYVITTRNSGSVVQEAEHGRVVAPGDARQLEAALRESIQDPNVLVDVGRKNASLIKSQYTQHNYGNRLVEIYQSLMKYQP